ncbi:hypothetical protein A2U01_0072748, partial [Trifolium medium]|nr:hypothetical protein [Trifolium medium]
SLMDTLDKFDGSKVNTTYGGFY